MLNSWYLILELDLHTRTHREKVGFSNEAGSTISERNSAIHCLRIELWLILPRPKLGNKLKQKQKQKYKYKYKYLMFHIWSWILTFSSCNSPRKLGFSNKSARMIYCPGSQITVGSKPSPSTLFMLCGPAVGKMFHIPCSAGVKKCRLLHVDPRVREIEV